MKWSYGHTIYAGGMLTFVAAFFALSWISGPIPLIIGAAVLTIIADVSAIDLKIKYSRPVICGLIFLMWLANWYWHHWTWRSLLGVAVLMMVVQFFWRETGRSVRS